MNPPPPATSTLFTVCSVLCRVNFAKTKTSQSYLKFGPTGCPSEDLVVSTRIEGPRWRHSPEYWQSVLCIPLFLSEWFSTLVSTAYPRRAKCCIHFMTGPQGENQLRNAAAMNPRILRSGRGIRNYRRDNRMRSALGFSFWLIKRIVRRFIAFDFYTHHLGNPPCTSPPAVRLPIDFVCTFTLRSNIGRPNFFHRSNKSLDIPNWDDVSAVRLLDTFRDTGDIGPNHGGTRLKSLKCDVRRSIEARPNNQAPRVRH